MKKGCPVVTYGENGNRKTKGFGTITCMAVQFSNVLKHNLIVTSKLCDVDDTFHFNKHEGKVINSNNVTFLFTKH